MSADFERLISIEVKVKASDPELLRGLDVWLRLGIITQEQINYLSRTYLSCHLPEPIVTKIPNTKSDFTPELDLVKIEPKKAKQPSFLAQFWQAFQDELSVRWLLFLGVFLVVVSSGVLAATQWAKFPAAGQYLILWAYTVIFWGVGFWASKQTNLRLTSQTLQTITLLLIPVNFWAMDSFNLWRYPWEWITVAISALSLSAIVYQEKKQRLSIKPFLFTFLALAYLHWGWSLANLSLIAVYMGMILTTIVLRFLPESVKTKGGNSYVLFALAVLLIRAIFIMQIPIPKLGLAIGICGWLLTGLDLAIESNLSPERQPGLKHNQSWQQLGVFQVIGAILLFIGWLVTFNLDLPIQAIIISGLALHFCSQRLRKYWLRRDLLAIFIIGLQSLFLIKELIPNQLRENALNVSVDIAQSQLFPQSVYSVTLFPYLLIFVWLTAWLYRQNQDKLANFGEWLILVFGFSLTLLSLVNPTWRSLNLLFSTLTLIFVTQRRFPLRYPLLYFTHLISLITIVSWIDWQFSPLNQAIWAAICLGIMIIEWSLSILQQFSSENILKQAWYQSCWYFGFLLAFISYILLLPTDYITYITTVEIDSEVIIWLLTPLTLTIVASFSQEKRQKEAIYSNCIALIMAQALTIGQPLTRVISLGIGAILMLINSYYIPNLTLAYLEIGFSIGLISALLWGKITISGWLLAGAIIIFFLWLLRSILSKFNHNLATIYVEATDTWAISLCGLETIFLTQNYLEINLNYTSANVQYLFAAIITSLALIYRYWKQPNNTIIYVLVWLAEIIISNLVDLEAYSTLTLATLNIIISLISLILIDIFFNKIPNNLASSFQDIPLIYGLLGLGWRLGYFNAYTGLLTLGFAIIGIGLNRLVKKDQSLVCFSLAAISLGIYELVIYQIFQTSGGSVADGLTILALVAAIIAIVYRSFAWFGQIKNEPKLIGLSINTIIITAHLHWFIASLLKLLTILAAVDTKPQLTILSISISIILAFYALIQGRSLAIDNTDNKLSDWWVYVGLIEIAATAIYARLIWTQLSILDPWRAILACFVSLIILQLPWRNLGWQETPWRRASLVIPALVAIVTTADISYLSLIVVAAFYIRIAIRQHNLRWTYVSLIFVDWAITRFLIDNQITDILGYISILGLSLLYIAQFDPSFRQGRQRQNRHNLRIFGSGIICLFALLLHQDTGIIPSIISIIFIFLGLGLKIRAFLFIGTTTFILTAFYQLVVLIFSYSLLKWIIGLITGILFISIAANFERSREQIIALLNNWVAQLREWQ